MMSRSRSLVVKNVCKLQKAPKVADSEMAIVQDVPDFVSRLRGAAERLYAPAIVALFTGMRLGEVLALRERSFKLDKGTIEVREALEETKAHGIRFKSAKTRPAGATSPCLILPLRRYERSSPRAAGYFHLGRIL